MPETQQAAAVALGTERYRAFIGQVSHLLAGGKSMGAGIMEQMKSELDEMSAPMPEDRELTI